MGWWVVGGPTQEETAMWGASVLGTWQGGGRQGGERQGGGAGDDGGRVLNLQRDPVSGEYFAIGKSGRLYTAAEVRLATGQGRHQGPAARAVVIDVDLALDGDGRRRSEADLQTARQGAAAVGWPSDAERERRRIRWERARALRQAWASVGFRRQIDRPDADPGPVLSADHYQAGGE
ncbi:MAG: hypothetical protein R3B06_03290 [Kofleriaceae bacterium]